MTSSTARTGRIVLGRTEVEFGVSAIVAVEHDMEGALRVLSGEFGKTRKDTIRFIVRVWMEKNLPVHSTKAAMWAEISGHRTRSVKIGRETSEETDGATGDMHGCEPGFQGLIFNVRLV